MLSQVSLDQTFRPVAYPTWLEYIHGACNLLRGGFVLIFDFKLEELPQLDFKQRTKSVRDLEEIGLPSCEGQASKAGASPATALK